MAVVGVAQEHPLSPEGTFEHNKYSITRRSKVQTNQLADGVLVVTAAIGIPRLYEPYLFGSESQVWILCRSIKASRITESSLYWTVEAEYSTPEPKEHGREGTGQEVSGQFENPLLELCQVSF